MIMRPASALLRYGSVAAALVMAVGQPAFAQPNPERNAYFGETHIHTSWSVDAWVMGNRITGPADARSERRLESATFSTDGTGARVTRL
jgi:hypothetical protein